MLELFGKLVDVYPLIYHGTSHVHNHMNVAD
jgi:hypothetical protein